MSGELGEERVLHPTRIIITTFLLSISVFFEDSVEIGLRGISMTYSCEHGYDPFHSMKFVKFLG
jgi:hypothetical protein